MATNRGYYSAVLKRPAEANVTAFGFNGPDVSLAVRMTAGAEIGANILNAASIWLAGRNSMHTWWTGIVGCLLFGWVFYVARLYADVALQIFFVATSIAGYMRWRRGDAEPQSAIGRTSPLRLLILVAIAVTVAALYGALLHRFTDAASPFADSLVLCFSVLGQLLLVMRRFETWWCWLLVNSVAVPLYISRGLYVTSALYFAFWINAWLALFHWRRLSSSVPTAIAATRTP
jgi:nicotinamide mononucleotide transporter